MFGKKIKHYNIDTEPMGEKTLIKTYPKNMSKDGKKTYQRMGWKDDGLELGPLGLQFLPRGDGDGDEEDHVLVGRGNLKLSMSFASFSVLGDDACTKRNVCLSSVSSLSLSVSHLHIHTHTEKDYIFS